MASTLSPANDLDQTFLTLLPTGTAEQYHFNRSNWLYQKVQVTDTGTVQLYQSLDGSTWKQIGTDITGPACVALGPEVFRFLKAKSTSGTPEVLIFSGGRLAATY